MNCKYVRKEYKWEIHNMDFDYCPSCGVHAPWVNDCKEEEE